MGRRAAPGRAALAILLLAASASPARPPRYEVVEYVHPLAPGSVRTYLLTDLLAGTSTEFSATVGPEEVLPQGTGRRVELSGRGAFVEAILGGRFAILREYRADGWYDDHVKPFRWPRRLRQGRRTRVSARPRWWDEGGLVGRIRRKERWTLLAVEPVTVPAGTFEEALRIRIERRERFPAKAGRSRAEITRWLARGAGIVREEVREDFTDAEGRTTRYEERIQLLSR